VQKLSEYTLNFVPDFHVPASPQLAQRVHLLHIHINFLHHFLAKVVKLTVQLSKSYFKVAYKIHQISKGTIGILGAYYYSQILAISVLFKTKSL